MNEKLVFLFFSFSNPINFFASHQPFFSLSRRFELTNTPIRQSHTNIKHGTYNIF